MLCEDALNIQRLRKNIFLTAYSYPDGPSHLASSFSTAEILYVLYMKGILRHNPARPRWERRDRMILSKGHAGLALYNILCMAGYFGEELLYTYCKQGAKMGGEPSMYALPGIEASTGSLGHGFSFGAGVALAQKIDQTNTRVYVILGDGECQEGTVWEAVMSAAFYRLDNLTVLLDCNRLQKMGTVKEVMGIDSWAGRWQAFGWHVDTVDGHDVQALTACLKKEVLPGAPRLVIAKTVKGKGVSVMENNADWHYRMPGKRELKLVMEELGITGMELEKCRERI
jgi:transketolase